MLMPIKDLHSITSWTKQVCRTRGLHCGSRIRVPRRPPLSCSILHLKSIENLPSGIRSWEFLYTASCCLFRTSGLLQFLYNTFYLPRVCSSVFRCPQPISKPPFFVNGHLSIKSGSEHHLLTSRPDYQSLFLHMARSVTRQLRDFRQIVPIQSRTVEERHTTTIEFSFDVQGFSSLVLLSATLG